MIDVQLAADESADDVRRVELPESPAEVRLAGGRVARELPPGASALAVPGLHGDRLAAFAEGLLLGSYRFTRRTSLDPLPSVVRLAGVTASDANEAALARARLTAGATAWARDLTNERSNVKTPAWLAEQLAAELDDAGAAVSVRDEGWLAEHGFGGALAVGGGSAAPPRFVEATYRPRGARSGVHVVVVGKGITFDTGGINRKPGDSMRTMHTDMAGGAAVAAALRALATDRVPVRVTALVPIAENSFGGGSYRPSDVVRHYGGRTSEINNTDAEGRIVMADAMAWAVARSKPTVLVDIATLTGAAKVALGTRVGGLFATDDDLAAQLLAAGEMSGEPLWRMPLDPDYESLVRSEIADGLQAPGGPGAITAALFLKPFAGAVPWAHLDIAGPARADKDDGIVARGATGFGARLLHAWVASLA